MTAEVELDGMLRRLHMPTVRRLWSDLQARAEQEGMRYADYLQVLVGEEIAHRSQTRISRMTHRARFPFLRTIEEFDFAYQSGLRRELLGSYLGPEFVPEGRSLLLYGPSGVGKTHVAIAIAYKAIQHGSDARFVTAAHLIDELSSASRDGKLREALEPYTHPGVLVVDEVGYLSYGPDAANVLFQVVNERHLHRRPMLFTTNKPIEEWGRVLHDPDLAEAILDRVLERGRVLHFKGPSFRTRHLQSKEGARISGKGGPEFQEPTYLGRLDGLGPLEVEEKRQQVRTLGHPALGLRLDALLAELGHPPPLPSPKDVDLATVRSYGVELALVKIADELQVVTIIIEESPKGGGPPLGKMALAMAIYANVRPGSYRRFPAWYARSPLPLFLKLPPEQVSYEATLNLNRHVTGSAVSSSLSLTLSLPLSS
jgi:DNA replication protein DnaC